MKDVYIEELIKRNSDWKDYLTIALLSIVGAVLSVFILILMFTFSPMLGAFSQMSGSVAMLLIAGVWFFIYRYVCSRSIEYEYIVINSSLDVDKVMAKKRRKRMLEIDIKNATVMASINDAENNAPYKNFNGKPIDLSAKSKNLDTYFIECSVDGKRQIVLFQPTSKMVDALWRYNPNVVKKYNA